MEIIIIVMFFIQLVLAFFAIKYKKTSTALRNILKNLNKKRNNALILVELKTEIIKLKEIIADEEK